jgi:hypothetical protein
MGEPGNLKLCGLKENGFNIILLISTELHSDLLAIILFIVRRDLMIFLSS